MPTGRQIFLEQLRYLNDNQIGNDWFGENLKDQALLGVFEVPEELWSAFGVYYDEYLRLDHHGCLGDTYFQEDVMKGIINKCYDFYYPIISFIEKEHPEWYFLFYVEPSYEDSSAIIIIARDKKFNHYLVHLDYWKVWNSPFRDSYSPQKVYEDLEQDYANIWVGMQKVYSLRKVSIITDV